jgi:hypothetical protein
LFFQGREARRDWLNGRYCRHSHKLTWEPNPRYGVYTPQALA